MLIVNQMKLLADLQDDQYPHKQITHNRIITRGVILNDKNEVLLLHLVGDDIFGHRDLYETPGGGIKPNETLEESLLREIKEETGIETEIIKPIGYVSDYYNLIGRHNNNYYYLLRFKKQGENHLEDYEKTIIKGMDWYSIDKAIELYKNMNKDKLEILVSNRELPVMIEVKRLIETI